MTTFPGYRSGVFVIDAELYRTDILNMRREDLSGHITDMRGKADLNFDGAKSEIEIVAHADVLNDGDWVAPYLTYAPETGPLERVQMGHYRLDTPEVTYDGTDTPRVAVNGYDILEMLDKAVLPETFVTPFRGNIFQDLRTLWAMATRGAVGPNMVANPSFEDTDTAGNVTGWINNGTFGGGGAGFISWTGHQANYGTPTGERAWGAVLNASVPAGALASIAQSIPIPGALVGQRIWVTGLWLPAHADHRGYITVSFRDASGTTITGPGKVITTPIQQRSALRWTREHAYGVIPENAATMFVTVVVMDAVGGSTGQRRSSWDDIAVHTISGSPLPEARIALPADPVFATTRIQSLGRTSFLEAMNDRLLAAGYNEMVPLGDGRITTIKKIETRRAAAARTYIDRDHRIIDTYSVSRAPEDRYNWVMAVKENLGQGTPLQAVAMNTDDQDPWSIGRMGQVPRVVVVQDAVDQAALQVTAQAELERAADLEFFDTTILPDPTLALHDVIDIQSTDRSAGKWELESYEWGATTEDPLVRVSARRVTQERWT